MHAGIIGQREKRRREKRRKKRRREVHLGDRVFYLSLKAVAVFVIFLLGCLIFMLGKMAWPAFMEFGLHFFTRALWNPVTEQFGTLSFLYGTLVSSFVAILIATPISIAVALFLNEIAPRKVGAFMGFFVEMLAAIPSVVFGIWGIFTLAPLLRLYVEPFLGNYFGWLPLFQGPPFGVGMLAAGVILAIMITPTITSICREVFRTIPANLREGAFALGATKWEMLQVAILKNARSGTMAAVVLGLGRALGETMAVTMVIGNRPQISASLFAPAQTMASIIANEYAEASSQMHRSALAAVGLSLFLVSLLINAGARYVLWRAERKLRGGGK
jgi:phosphate transport system permease protein